MFSNRQFWDDLAIQSYKEILKSKPDSPIIHNNLGLAYVRVNKINKAVRSFQRAVKYDKSFTEAYYHLGTALQKMGKKKEAVRAFNNYYKCADEAEKKAGVVSELLDELRTPEEQI